MEIDFDVRDDWVCPLREIEYQNVTRKYPMQLYRNSEELIQGKGINSKLNELVLSLVTRNEPSQKSEKDLRDKVIVSSKVKLELYIDPDWSVGALQNILRTNVGHIHKLAKSLKKEKDEQGIKFSDPKEFDEKRFIRTIEANLSYLGYYRLLECEKMEWADVNSIFMEKFASNSDRRVIPKSYEQYRYNVAKHLPGLKHSKYHS